MKLTYDIIYGLQILAYLSKIKRRANTNELSKILRVSSLYLRQLVLPLEKKKFIKSFKGKKGGFIIIKPPKTIKFQDVFEAYGEKFSIISCLIPEYNKCNNLDKCKIRKIFLSLRKEIKSFFKKYTIADLIEE